MKQPIRGLRWWICGLLLFATTVNYLDRTTLGTLKETIKADLRIQDTDFAHIVVAFQLSYAIGQMVAGKVIDWIGTRVGYLAAFLWWSIASMAHALAGSVAGFAACRFLLGVGEAGNFPCAIKAVSEWFPRKERALATGILNVGAGVGIMLSPWLIYLIMAPTMLGLGWQEAFIGTGVVGLIWVFFWLWLYRKPEEHPRISPAERAYIEAGREREAASGSGREMSWFSLFRYPQVWGVIAARVFSDPVWWFWVYWFQGYLQKYRHFSLGELAAFSWIPFLMSDFGSLAGGLLSTFFANRVRSILLARKLSMTCCAAVMPLAIWAGLADSAGVAIALVGLVALAHQAWSASVLTLPTDLFPSRYVGAVYGITAMAGGLSGLVYTELVGYVSDTYHTFVPMFVGAGLMHLTGLAIAALLIRRPIAEEPSPPGA